MIAPPALSRTTSLASLAGTESCRAIEPTVVGVPFTSIESSMITGIPCSGPRRPSVDRSASSALAWSIASRSTERTAWVAGPSAFDSPIRAR